MSKVVLYDYWRSSASYRVRIALNLLGIDYEAVPIDLTKKAHRSPEHMARNPQGFVPALEIDGRLLTQSVAILEYLAETRPDTGLLPEAPAEKARVRALSHSIAMDIHPICNLHVVTHVMDLTGEGDAARLAWMQRFIGKGLTAFEAILNDPATGTFCHGDTPGMADCCLVPQIFNARRWKSDISDMPRINAVMAACEALGSFADAHPDIIGAP
ncbi:MAG: maleylacetoacetate isomerase [Pseudomonadota bacterium]